MKQILLLFVALTAEIINNGFSQPVTGTVSIVDPTASYIRGDLVNFQFTLSLQKQENVSQTTITISSSTLAFRSVENVLIETQISWIYTFDDNGTDIVGDRYSINLNVTEIVDVENHFQVIVDSGDILDFRGNATMVIRDTVGSAEMFGCAIIVTYVIIDNSTSVNDSYTIQSDSAYTRFPTFDLIGQLHPMYVEVNQPLILDITMNIPSGPFTPVVEAMMPYSSVSREAMLVVNTMYVNDVTDAEFSVDPFTLSSTLLSTGISYQKDIGVLNFETFTSMANESKTGNELVVRVQATLEDYIDIENDTEWWLGAGVKFSDNWIWLAEVPVYVIDNSTRRPHMGVTLTKVNEYGYDGKMVVTIEVKLDHNSSSTAFGRNIKVVLYQMPFSSYDKLIYVTGTEYIQVYTVAGITFLEIARIVRYTESPTLHFNFTLDTFDHRFWTSDIFFVLAELSYDGGTENAGLYYEQIVDLPFALNVDSAERLHWTASQGCLCVHNATLSDCACCLQGGCQCGEQRPNRCEKCDKMWRCRATPYGYDQHSSYTDSKGNLFVCESYQRFRTSMTSVSCFRKETSGAWKNVDPTVSVIVGETTSNGYLYGLTNNGLGYAVSKDGGLEWQTMAEYYFYRDVNHDTFVNASMDWEI